MNPRPFQESVNGKHILVLSPTPTWPLDHGNRKKIYTYCKALRDAGARIHFVLYPLEWPFSHVPSAAIKRMTEQWDMFMLAPVTVRLYEWAKGEDHTIDEWWDPALDSVLRFLFSRNSYDAFIVNYPFMSKALEFAPASVLKILDTHDKFSNRRQLLESNGIQKEFFYTTPEQERIALERADIVWAIKEEEQTFFQSLTSKPKTLSLPHCELDLADLAVGSPAGERQDGLVRFGMIGARNNINRVNAERFVQHALPLIRRSLAPVEIVFAGGLCEDLSWLSGTPGVRLLGRVDSVAEFYGQIDVVLIPMGFSTGLKIKAIEAFATGKPVICNGHAAEGIPVTHPLHQCVDELAVTEACIAIGFDEIDLDELRIATLEVNRRLQHRFSSVLGESFTPLRQQRSIVISAKQEFFNPQSLYREHVLHLVEYLKHLGKIIIHFESLPKLPGNTYCERFNGLGAACQLAVSELPTSLDDFVPGLLYRTESLASLTQRPEVVAVWLSAYDKTTLSEPPRTAMTYLCRETAGDSAVPDWIKVVDLTPTRSGENRPADLCVPYFRREPGVFWRAGIKPLVLFSCESIHLPLVKYLATALENRGVAVQAICHGELDRREYPPPIFWADIDARNATWSFQDRPTAYFSLLNPAEPNVWDEAARRHGVRLSRATGSVYELTDMLLSANWHEDRPEATLDRLSLYANDAGWNALWRDIDQGGVSL